MKWTIVILLIASTAFTDGDNCWDGTYAYRVSSWQRNGHEIEMGFSASIGLFKQLATPPVHEIVDENLISVRHPYFDTTVYLRFDDSDCTMLSSRQITCERHVEPGTTLNKRAFISRQLRHLGENSTVISEIFVSKISATMSETNAHAYLEDGGTFAGIGIDIPKVNCAPSGELDDAQFRDAYFTDELRGYIAK